MSDAGASFRSSGHVALGFVLKELKDKFSFVNRKINEISEHKELKDKFSFVNRLISEISEHFCLLQVTKEVYVRKNTYVCVYVNACACACVCECLCVHEDDIFLSNWTSLSPSEMLASSCHLRLNR